LTRRVPFRPCAKENCRKVAMHDGSGYCSQHNPAPAQAQKRRDAGAKRAITMQSFPRSSRQICGVSGCRGWPVRASPFCMAHYRNHAGATSDKDFCTHPGCQLWAMLDSSGFCFFHNPALRQRHRQAIQKQVNTLLTAPRTPHSICPVEGCRAWPMAGTAFCVMHTDFKRPPERACAVTDCRNWTVRQSSYCVFHYLTHTSTSNIAKADKCTRRGCHNWAMRNGSGLCLSHNPTNIARMQKRMKGNKLNLGRHLPYLGLENIQEARGLIFYSLQHDKPLLLLRALTKVASLAARGEMET
jgi:hypothetical protein